MLHLALHGKRLFLRPGTSLNMELVNPLLADGIEDSRSMPVELPIEGNEIALGHVHRLALSERNLLLPGMQAGHNGLPLHEGALTILGSDSKTVRGTLSAEGFVVLMGDKTLRAALANLLVDMVATSGSIAAHVVAANAAASMLPGDGDTGWTHYFPLYKNPSLYGSENPSWYPSASDWDASKAYDVDELISYAPPDTVRVPRRYQCIIATSAGQNPYNAASKWKEVAHGLVNVMDSITGEPVSNDSAGNYYALVPWMRLRYLVLQVLNHFGLQATGDAFAADGPLGPQSMYALGNNTPLDAELQDHYFHAAQTSDVAYVPGDDHRQFRIPAQDDSTSPYSDVDGVWDTSTSQFTPPDVGRYRFLIAVKVNFNAPMRLKVVVRKADGTGYPAGYFLSGLVYMSQDVLSSYDRTVGFDINVGAGQVGAPIHFCVEAYDTVVIWPTLAEHTYTASRIQGWRTEADGINSFRPVITVADHVPDWTAAEFLDAVADAFNLEVVPDMTTRQVRFSRRMKVLQQHLRNTSHHSHRLLGDPELDHSRRIPGVKMAWDVDLGENPALQGMYRLPDVLWEHELEAPNAAQQYILVRSTRRIYASVFKAPDGFAWEQRGYLVPEALEGERTNARDLAMAFVPPHMEEVRLNADRYLVPLVDEAGNSSFFATAATEGKAWLCIANGYSMGKEGAPHVTANSWGRPYSSLVAQPRSLLLSRDQEDNDAPTNHWQEHHRAWWEMIVRAEPVTANLLVDHAYLRSEEPRRFQVMRNLTYLMERMPMVYDDQHGPLICKGAYLLRLRSTPLPTEASDAVETCPVYQVWNTVSTPPGEDMTLTPYSSPHPYPDMDFGAARYKRNGGPWITLTIVPGTPNTIAYVAGDEIVVEAYNLLRPDCPPNVITHTFE